jgi:general secretion pathway protein K
MWMSAALAAIALALAASVRLETARASTNSDGLRAWYLASGSVERGIQWMMWGPGYRYPDGAPRFWEPNTPRMYVSYPSGEATIEMIPEMSKFNINTISETDLTRLVATLTQNPAQIQQVVAGVLSWRGSGGGAPIFAPGQTFQPRGASFEEIEELLLVPGVTPELYYGSYETDAQGRLYPQGGLRDSLSVWGSNGPFDLNTVSPAILETLGAPPAIIPLVLARRTQKPFRNVNEAGDMGLPTNRLMLGGNTIWTLRATARLRQPDGNSSDTVRSASAVLKLLDRAAYFQEPVQVLRYYDDAWSQFAVTPGKIPSQMIPRPGAVVH